MLKVILGKGVIKMGNAENTYLSIKDVSKDYGAVKAVNKINLEVHRGKFLTILGPSGSGKTTLLEMIAGFEAPTGGDIFLNEQNITHKKPYQRDIGMLFQNYALFPHMTVSQNIAYPLKLRKVNRKVIQQEVQKNLELVQLTEYADRYPRQLSGGQQQRVALARAIIFNPPLLLLDEPLSALDKNLRGSMQLEIKHIQEKIGITTISVTHDQEEALVMSDLVCVMNKGRIEQVATPFDLYQYPKNEFVAKFIGEINLLPGELVSNDSKHMVVRMTENPNTTVTVVNMWGEEWKEKDVYVAIRPENIHLVTEDMHYENTINVKIVEKIYLGNSLKIRTVTAGGTIVTVKLSALLASSIHEGGDVTLGWNSTESTLVPKEEKE